ncbi:MAG: transposase [Acidobacteriota bacterium]
MRPYSIDLRIRIVEAKDRGDSISEIAEIFNVGKTLIKNLLRRRRETGQIEPLPHGGGASRLITEEAEQIIKEKVAQHNDITLEELCEYVKKKSKIEASLATMSRTLERLNLPRKKV